MFLIFCNLHLDGVTDIIGIFLYEVADFVFLKEIRVFFIVGIGFDMKDNFRTPVGFVAGGYVVTLRTRTRPHVGFVRAERLRAYFHLVGNHKRRIETYAELTYNRNVVVFFKILVLFLKSKRAALCDSTEVFFEFLGGHTNTVILYGKRSRAFVGGNFNGEVAARKTRQTLFHSFKIKFVDSVRTVGQ